MASAAVTDGALGPEHPEARADRHRRRDRSRKDHDRDTVRDDVLVHELERGRHGHEVASGRRAAQHDGADREGPRDRVHDDGRIDDERLVEHDAHAGLHRYLVECLVDGPSAGRIDIVTEASAQACADLDGIGREQRQRDGILQIPAGGRKLGGRCRTDQGDVREGGSNRTEQPGVERVRGREQEARCRAAVTE
jgi:hypothetical protein